MIRISRSGRLLLTAPLLGLAACSGGPEQTGAPDARSEPPIEGVAGKVTPEYLEGPWCYLRFEAGGEASVENIDYVFGRDGSLAYQTGPDTPVDMPGSYTLEKGVLTVKPALGSFALIPTTVTDDGMVLEAMGGQFYWARGDCGG